MKVDQAALTGESLAVSKRVGDVMYSGSTVKQGEGEFIVTSTGERTFIGRAAKLVATTENSGHFQQVRPSPLLALTCAKTSGSV